MTDRTPHGGFPSPLGTTGLTQYGGFTAEEWDRRLQGLRGPKMWREMGEASPTIGAALLGWRSMVLATGWRLDDADESEEAQKATGFVEECFEDMEGALSGTFTEVFGCRPFGFSLLETVYKVRQGDRDDPQEDSKYDDGRIGWADWSPRAQETIIRWRFDAQNRPVSAYQVAPPTYREVELPLSKCLHFVTNRRKGNPEGTSVLRNAFEPYYYFKNISRIEAIGVERDLAGLPVIGVDADTYADQSKRDSWIKVGTDLRRDEQACVVYPLAYDERGNQLYKIDLLSTGGSRQIDTDPILARYERLMLRSLLMDFLTLGDQGRGSYAQSVNRTDLFLQSAKGELQAIEDVVNYQGIRRLFKLNGMPLALAPRFTFNELSSRNVKDFADSVVALAGAGIVDVNDPATKRTVYEVIGLPLAEETALEQQQQGDEGLTGAGQTPNAEAAAAAQAAQQAPPAPQPPKTPPSVPAKGQPAMQASDPDPVKVTIDADAIREALAFWDTAMKDYPGETDVVGMLAAKAAA